MIKPDSFSDHYQQHLDGIYECPGRIVMNGYCYLGHNPGGFRVWWRRLYGNEEKLNNNQLMRFSGHFSRRIRAAMGQRGITVHYLEKNERAHEIAEAHIPDDPNYRGVFLVTIGKAPAVAWDVQYSSDGERIRNIKKRDPLPYLNHYAFHIMDPDWGHVTFKISGQPPFPAQISFNGHEYIERQAMKQGLTFSKEGNCFTEVSDAAALVEIAETLRSPNAVGQLAKVCERWIYSACLCFALNLEDQRQSGFRYDFSLYQIEYSRNLLLKRGSEMEQLFQSVIDRTRAPLDLKTLRTIFGYAKRPYHRKTRKGKKEKEPRLQVVVKRPVYDMTVFKIDFDAFTAKIYTKGERVLRVEVILHNARKVPGRRTIPKLHEAIEYLHGILNRFLNVVQSINASFIGPDVIEDWATPSQVGQARVAGFDLNKPRLRHVVDAVIALAPNPNGFRVYDLAEKVRAATGWSEDDYKITQAAYDLK